MDKNIPKSEYEGEELLNLLQELKDDYNSSIDDIQKSLEIITNKLMKIQEYNKILDMTNQVFEMRMSNVEDLLFKISSINN